MSGLRFGLPKGVALRRLKADEPGWGAILNLIRRSFAYMDGVIDPPSSAMTLTQEALVAKSAKEIALGLFSEKRPVACVFLDPRPDCLYIGKLAVEPQMQGKGLGSCLIQEAEAVARHLGLARLELQTRVELAANHTYFAARGFAKAGESSHAGFSWPTSILMRMEI